MQRSVRFRMPSRASMRRAERVGRAMALCAVLAIVAGTAAAADATTAIARPVTLWLAGDSTLAPKRPAKRPETGWGEALEPRFLPGTVLVDNRAVNGRSTRTFIAEGRWDALVEALRPGDHVMVQFGHNDGSVEKPDRYTSPADYRANLVRFVRDVRAHGAVPILLTPVARRRFDARGVLQHSHGVYPGLVREVAATLDVAMIDLLRASEAILAEAGAEDAKRLFLWLAPGDASNYPDGLQDDTHFSPAGADRMAAAVADALRDLDVPLSRHVAPRAVPSAPAPGPGAIEDRGGGAPPDRPAVTTSPAG